MLKQIIATVLSSFLFIQAVQASGAIRQVIEMSTSEAVYHQYGTEQVDEMRRYAPHCFGVFREALYKAVRDLGIIKLTNEGRKIDLRRARLVEVMNFGPEREQKARMVKFQVRIGREKANIVVSSKGYGYCDQERIVGFYSVPR